MIRIALALTIMASHLVYIGNEWGGAALTLFYALSGYGIVKAGIRPGFWLNRLARLYPAYLATAIATATALLLGWVPQRPYLALPTTIQAWALQLLMVVPTWPEPALVPIGWMLKWMLLGYALLWLGIAKTPQRTGLWLLAMVTLSAAYLVRTQSAGLWYQSPWSALLAMAAGATAAHLDVVIPKDRAWSAEMSYPVFLLHYPVGAALPLAPGWPLFFAALPPTLALSWLLVVVVERPVQRYRNHLRSRNIDGLHIPPIR